MKIVFLQYASNVCYVQVVAEAPQGVAVDVGNQTWTVDWPQKRTYKIGQSHYCGDTRGGIIGVYDADDLNQLGSMVRAATEAVRERHGGDD